LCYPSKTCYTFSQAHGGKMIGRASRQGLRKRWDIMPAAPFQQLQSLHIQSPLLAQVLYNRGLREPGDVDGFLYAEEADPFLLADMDRAVSRLQRALERDESIAVFGDFDVDGVSGTALPPRVRLAPVVGQRIEREANASSISAAGRRFRLRH
ncbi:MAG: hypothetical protein Q7R39_09080, partial [Dehalococcoidia bacterium]|nr:hypothetical protein [Dehalococcoidia bacterium]